MNDSRPDSRPAEFRGSSHGRFLMLVAAIMLVVPAIVIALLSNLPDEVGQLVTCRGTILVNGQPLASGKIITRKADAQSGESNSTGVIDAHGKFQLTTDGQPGVRVGHHHLAVISDARTGGVRIPESFRSLESTKLSIDVQPESRFNVFTLNIKVDD